MESKIILLALGIAVIVTAIHEAYVAAKQRNRMKKRVEEQPPPLFSQETVTDDLTEEDRVFVEQLRKQSNDPDW